MTSLSPFRENKLLARITWIEILGDFISFFAVLKLIQSHENSAILAGYSVLTKAAALGFGAYFVPKLIFKLQTKRVLFVTQILSALLTLIPLLIALGFQLPLEWVFVFLFSQTFLKQIFEGAKESHSRFLSDTSSHRVLQIELMLGGYLAQFLGPILSFVLLKNLPVFVPIVLDGVSFLGASLLVLTLQNSFKVESGSSILRPFQYLWAKTGLRDIVIARSVIFWIGMSIFNFTLFSVVIKKLNLELIYSAFVYSAMGLGAALGTEFIRYLHRKKIILETVRVEAVISIFGVLGLGVSAIGFSLIGTLGLSLVLLVCLGAFMAFNAVSTQTIRRMLASKEEFPEIVGFEVVFSRGTDLLVGLLIAHALKMDWVSELGAMGIAAGAFCFCAGWMGWRLYSVP